MELSNFVPDNKEQSLLLNLAKSNLDIAQNTLSKPQETLEFKMKKQKQIFAFDTPINIPDNWMMGVTSLEVYNTVYNITERNNKFQILLDEEEAFEILHTRQKRSQRSFPGIIREKKQFPKAAEIIKIYEETDDRNKLVEALTLFYPNIQDDNFEFVNFLKDNHFTVEEIITITTTEESVQNRLVEINKNVFIENKKLTITLNPGVYELVEINNSINQILNNFPAQITIKADTISMKSLLTTTHPIVFNSELNYLLGFTEKYYGIGTHRSEKPIMITPVDKVHLKCDCVDGSIVNGVREQILFSFNLSAPPGYKIIKEPTTILYKKINKTRLDYIQFSLEDSNHNPVNFNNESLTFTIQIIKI